MKIRTHGHTVTRSHGHRAVGDRERPGTHRKRTAVRDARRTQRPCSWEERRGDVGRRLPRCAPAFGIRCALSSKALRPEDGQDSCTCAAPWLPGRPGRAARGALRVLIALTGPAGPPRCPFPASGGTQHGRGPRPQKSRRRPGALHSTGQLRSERREPGRACRGGQSKAVPMLMSKLTSSVRSSLVFM